MKHKLRWASVALYCLLIFYISSLDLGEAIPPESRFRGLLDFTTDLHVPEYMILGGLLYWASQDAPVSILSSALYGVTDELHQWFVPNRYMDPYDIMVDWFGSLVGVILMIVVISYLSPLAQNLAGVRTHFMRYGMGRETTVFRGRKIRRGSIASRLLGFEALYDPDSALRKTLDKLGKERIEEVKEVV